MDGNPCAHETAAAALACPRCAGADPRRCPACAAAMPGDSRFCSQCGVPLDPLDRGAAGNGRNAARTANGGDGTASAVEPAGERKPVTILFVQVHGALDLSLELEAEQWHAVITRFFAILSREVRRQGGVIDRFTGEGIKARFGAPIAHESHARQACEAALRLADELGAFGRELRRTLGIAFPVRMGLHSGEALYGPMGASGIVTFSAQGHTAALAARMEQIAPPGAIYLTESTAELVRDFFRVRSLGALDVRGVAQPLCAYELVARGEHASDLDVARARGFSRFVGRDVELAALEAALEASQRSGQPRVLGIVGEPGIGKSRLLDEFVGRCRARGVGVSQFRSLEAEQQTPFGLGRRFVLELLGIRERDDPEAARRDAGKRLLELDPELRDTLALAFDMLGLATPQARPPSGYEARVEQLVNIVLRIVAARPADVPAVYVFDDRHWTDPASEAVTRIVFERGFQRPLVVLMALRPGYRQPWMLDESYSEITLQPLSRDAGDALVRAFLGDDPSLEELVDDIRERSGGNPFFMEELLRTLVDSGTLTGTPGSYRVAGDCLPPALPPTLRAVLAARLDHLPPREKTLLQTAAVIGVRFTAPLLARIAGMTDAETRIALDALCALELVDRDPDRAPVGYQFRHGLMRESAERSLLRGRRNRLHAAVAAAILEEAGGDADASAARIADHWERAGNPAEAARWVRRAAAWAAPRDPAQALAHWRRLRAIAHSLGDGEWRDELALAACLGELDVGWHQGIPPQEAATVFEEGRRLAEGRRDPRASALLAATYGDIRASAGDVDEAVRLGREACTVAERTEDAGLALVLRSRLTITLYEAGDLAATLAIAGAPEPQHIDPHLGRADLGFSPAIYLEVMRGLALVDLGRFEAGREELEAAAARARRIGDRPSLCVAVAGLAAYPRLTGIMPAGLIEQAREAVAIADATGSRFLRVAARAGLGLVAYLEGAIDEARSTLDGGLAIVGTGGVSFHNESTLRAMLSLVYLAQGEPERALESARRALEVLRGRGRKIWEIDATLRWTRVASVVGGVPGEQVFAALDRAQQLIVETGALSREPLLRSVAGVTHALLGDPAAARAALAEAIALCDRLGATGNAEGMRLFLDSRHLRG